MAVQSKTTTIDSGKGVFKDKNKNKRIIFIALSAVIVLTIGAIAIVLFNNNTSVYRGFRNVPSFGTFANVEVYNTTVAESHDAGNQSSTFTYQAQYIDISKIDGYIELLINHSFSLERNDVHFINLRRDNTMLSMHITERFVHVRVSNFGTE